MKCNNFSKNTGLYKLCFIDLSDFSVIIRMTKQVGNVAMATDEWTFVVIDHFEDKLFYNWILIPIQMCVIRTED